MQEVIKLILKTKMDLQIVCPHLVPHKLQLSLYNTVVVPVNEFHIIITIMNTSQYFDFFTNEKNQEKETNQTNVL